MFMQKCSFNYSQDIPCVDIAELLGLQDEARMSGHQKPAAAQLRIKLCVSSKVETLF